MFIILIVNKIKLKLLCLLIHIKVTKKLYKYLCKCEITRCNFTRHFSKSLALSLKMQQVPHIPPPKKKPPPHLYFQVFSEQDEDMFTLIGTIKEPLNYVSSDLEYQMSNYTTTTE